MKLKQFKQISDSKRNFLMRLLIGSAALVMSIAAYSSYQVVRNTMLESLKRNAFLEVQQGGDDLDRWLSNLKTHLETLATSPPVQSMDWLEAEPYLKAEVLRFSDSYAMAMARSDGWRTVTGGSPTSIRDRQYFQRAIAGQTNISDPLVSRTSATPTVVVATPIRQEFDTNSSAIGTLQNLIRLDRIAQVVNSIGYGRQSYAFALNSNGGAIVHPDTALTLNTKNSAANLTQATDSNLAVIAQRMVKRQQGIELLPIDGTLQYVAYLPLKEADWSVALVIPRKNIESQLRSLDVIALVAFGLAGTMLVILWQVQALEQRHLKQSKEVLEQRVIERTAKLSATLEQLQQSQLRLVQSEKMSALGSLVAGVAHEINNPVSFIFGNLNHVRDYTRDLLNLLQLYQKHYPSPHNEIWQQEEAIDLPFLVEDLPRTVASMQIGADRIRQIVLSLRNFSRLDHSEIKPVDIHEGIDSTLLILQHRIKATPSRPEVQIIREYGELPRVECYAGQLNQVFMNILSNAIDAIEEAFFSTYDALEARETQEDLECSLLIIRVTTQRYGLERVRICIADNGNGMSTAVQQRIFDPFFTTKEVGKGTGMGMSISYQIVAEKHGGSMWCESTPGQGAAFWIEIPIRPLRDPGETTAAEALAA